MALKGFIAKGILNRKVNQPKRKPPKKQIRKQGVE